MVFDTQSRYESLLARLRERHYRLTPQRLALIRLIAASEGHPNAAKLYEQVKVHYPTTSLATVYKTLELLKEMGEVLEIDLHSDSHYDGNKPYPHPHLICTGCGRILDGELDDAVEALVASLERSQNFKVLRHQLNFYGLCAACRAEATE